MQTTEFIAARASIVDGNRIAVPPALYPDPSADDGRLLTALSPRKPSIVLMPARRLDQLLSRLQRAQEFSVASDWLHELVFGHLRDLVIEENRQIELPEGALGWIAAEHEVVVAGVPAVFRIWGKAAPFEELRIVDA